MQLLVLDCRTSEVAEAVNTSRHSAAAAAGIAVVCVASVLIVIGILAVFRHPGRRQVASLHLWTLG